MSLIGIDVGSTGTKLIAYNQEGTALGSVYATHTPHHPFPGTWELDAEEVWTNTANGLRELAGMKSIRQNPPRIMAARRPRRRRSFPLSFLASVFSGTEAAFG